MSVIEKILLAIDNDPGIKEVHITPAESECLIDTIFRGVYISDVQRKLMKQYAPRMDWCAGKTREEGRAEIRKNVMSGECDIRGVKIVVDVV